METNGNHWDAIVIGGGMAGLTASIHLARAGMKALVLERAPRPGGRAATTELDGSRINLGPHALYKSSLEALREVGVEPRGGYPKPGGSLLVYRGRNGDDKAYPLPQLFLGSTLRWSEKLQMIRFLTGVRRENPDRWMSVGLLDYLEPRVPGERARKAVLALVRTATYCHAPDRLSAGAAIGQLQLTQVMYAEGGWGSLVEQLREKAVLAGVTIRCGSAALSVSGSAPAMAVTLKDGSRETAARVLSTLGPKSTLALLETPLDPADAAAFETAVPVRAACLDLAMRGMPKPRATFAIGADDPWYFSNHSAVTALTDDPGISVVHVLKYLAPEAASDAGRDERELERMLDLIQPGWRGHVVHRRYLPNMLVAHDFPRADRGGIAGRPGPAIAGRPGLYVAGDWVGADGMLLDAVLASAKLAARQMIAANDNENRGIRNGA